MGEWKCNSSSWIEEWDSFKTDDGDFLFIRSPKGKGWHRHVTQPGRRRRLHRYFLEYLTFQDSFLRQLPSLQRVSYKNYRDYIEITSCSPPPHIWNNEDEDKLFWENLIVHEGNLKTVVQDILNPAFLQTTPEIHLLIRDYARGTIIAVSDGSHFPDCNKAAAAWLIESACGTQWIMGSMFVPGPSAEYTSYRSELIGLLAISATLRVLACLAEQPRHVIIGCDGQAALQSLAFQ